MYMQDHCACLCQHTTPAASHHPHQHGTHQLHTTAVAVQRANVGTCQDRRTSLCRCESVSHLSHHHCTACRVGLMTSHAKLSWHTSVWPALCDLLLCLVCAAYDYPCQGPAPGQSAAADVDVCKLASVPFRGVGCSDAAGAQKCYWEVMSCEDTHWEGQALGRLLDSCLRLMSRVDPTNRCCAALSGSHYQLYGGVHANQQGISRSICRPVSNKSCSQQPCCVLGPSQHGA